MKKPKFITKFFDPSPRFAGGYLANLLGYHIVRILFFQTMYALKSGQSVKSEEEKKILKTLQKDGIVVLPNFFPPDVFKAIKEECDSLDLKVTNERAPRIVKENVVGENIKTLAPLLEEHLAKNKLINDVVSAAMRQEVV